MASPNTNHNAPVRRARSRYDWPAIDAFLGTLGYWFAIAASCIAALTLVFLIVILIEHG
jgi:hypothetical protein